jgi:uncharacterized membrane-anchored protein YjiN (DUF445 family)
MDMHRDIETLSVSARAAARRETPASAPDQRVVELRRMRTIATLLLVAMTLLFLACALSRLDWPFIPYVRAFAEAGMVGACADWFAVVALFRHPIGVPIPHTAVVPRNKQRIGGALGRFITNNFLSPRVASARLRQIDVVAFAAHWIEDPDNSAKLGQWVARIAPQAIEQIPPEDLGAFLGRIARSGVESIPAAPLAAKVLSVLWAEGSAQKLLDQALDFAEGSLQRHKGFITQKVAEQSSRWIPKWVDNIIAARVMNGLLSTMREMRELDHPWRVELRKAVGKFIDDLATDPALRTQGEAMKAELLVNPVFLDQVKSLWTELEKGLYGDLSRFTPMAADLVAATLQSFGKWLEEDAGRKARLNRQFRLTVLRVLLPRRAEIGAYFTQVVDNWDTATLVNRLELQVGKDLQYIRINGTLVGGLVGLLIFSFSKLIGAA